MAAKAAAAPVASKLSALALVAASTAAVAFSYDNKSAVSCGALPVHGAAGTNQERTFLAVKPDGVQRGLIGDIIARFEKRGYKVRIFVDFDLSVLFEKYTGQNLRWLYHHLLVLLQNNGITYNSLWV